MHAWFFSTHVGTVAIVSFEQSAWNLEFQERLKGDAFLVILDGQDEKSVREALCNQKFAMLFIVAEEVVSHSTGHRNNCSYKRLLEDIESSPTLSHYKVVVIASTDQIKQLGSSINCLQRGTAIQTAESILSQCSHHNMQGTSARVALSRRDHLQNRKNRANTTERIKGKGKVKQKLWPLRKAKSDGSTQVNERKQHSSVDSFRDPMISDIHSKVCGIEKSLEYLRKFSYS